MSPEVRPWLAFRGTEVQRVIHNLHIDQIERCRNSLETAEPDKVLALQGEIRGLRAALAIVHTHDTPEITKTYG